MISFIKILLLKYVNKTSQIKYNIVDIFIKNNIDALKQEIFMYPTDLLNYFDKIIYT